MQFLPSPDTPYQMVREYMKNCVEEIFYTLEKWLSTSFATYGNTHNTFTGSVYSPVTFDYIFHRSNNVNRTTSWTYWFELPLFKLKIFEDLVSSNDTTTDETATDDGEVAESRSEGVAKKPVEKEISYSDHEAIESTIYFWT